MINIHRLHTVRTTRGFSLIEIMIAVVVLATGLLALAALQGALARNSADSKARGAVMAALTSRMNEIRQAPPSAGKTWTSANTAAPADSWFIDALNQAAASDLTVVETLVPYLWNGTGYITTAVTNPASSYFRATLTASWKAADGASKTLSLASDISTSIYGDNGFPLPPSSTSSASKFPVMRRSNPGLTDGVIPIAFGTSATAASNPRPDIEGPAATRFEVTTYVPEGSTAVITKRFDTKVINCRCTLGTDPELAEKRDPQWPAEWTGLGYKVYKPDDGSSPPGTSSLGYEDSVFSGYKANGQPGPRKQSPQCTECCRDHRPSSSAGAKFDPEDPSQPLMNLIGSSVTPVAVGGDNKFVASCRVIQVGGYWRTASDIYARQFALLKTKELGGKVAGTGVPEGPTSGDCSTPGSAGLATCIYQSFAKKFLAGYSTAGVVSAPASPNDAQTMFNAEASGALNSPTFIAIPAPLSTDLRFLHARGLYVDYLGTIARAKVDAAVSSCGANAECILPFIPFTSINVTELAKWNASAVAINVSPGGKLAVGTLVDKPAGGRTFGSAVGTANAVSVIRSSNSGLASGTSQDVANGPNIMGGVDTNDATQTLTDADNQSFTVGIPNGGGGDPSDLQYIVLRKSGYSYSFPPVNVIYGSGETADCTLSGSERRCPFPAGTLPSSITLDVLTYNFAGTESDSISVKNPCENSGKPLISVPYRRIFDISGFSPTGLSPNANGSVSGNDTLAEATRYVSSTSLPAVGGEVAITFSAEKLLCPAMTCTVGTNKIPSIPLWETSGNYSVAQCTAVGLTQP